MTRAIALATLLFSGVTSAWAKPPRVPGLCETAATTPAAAPYIGIFSAFPAELAPLVAALEYDETVEVDGQPFHVGRLDGVNAVLGLLGIGMINAENATERMLAHFDVAAIIVSGVAGSAHNIGDVVIAEGWLERDLKGVWRPNKALLAYAESAAAHLPEPFDTCTPVPPTDPNAPPVCMAHTPALHFEPLGQSDDDFGDTPFACIPGRGELFGCELPSPAGAFLGATALAFSILLLEPSLTGAAHRFWERTIAFQLDRDSPFSIWGWGQYHAAGIPDLASLQTVVQLCVIVLAGVAAAVPRDKHPLELAALTAALLLSFELALTHWSYLYLPWVLPFVLLALFLPRTRPET